MNVYQFIIQSMQYIVPPASAIIAGYFGLRYGLKQSREEKKIDIIEEQLNKFYSPLLAFHKELKCKGEIRCRISKTGDEVWKEKVNQKGKDDMQYVDKEIQYNNEQLKKELLPLYYKMIDIFRENYWLADPETQKYYPKLVEFVEIWKRWMEKSIDPDVVKRIGSNENELEPFYRELEERTRILRSKIV